MGAMRIIRFIDKDGTVQFGREGGDGQAALLTQVAPGQWKETGRAGRIGKLLAPVEPTAILCIGLNYRKHAQESGLAIPEHPVLFMKNPAALNHPGDPIVLPRSCMDPLQVDYECELAVVIGRAARNVSADQALDYVLGYTAGNDVSARIWQKQAGGGQWVRGKSFDTFCPLGPVLVTADELPDPQSLDIRTTLNGQVMQQANTGDMIFPVAELISQLSCGMTLRAGTVILTGTPSGVGMARTPPVFLKPGDVVEVTVQGIGTLSNPVAAEG
jgi:2-keto-4-pentenoate hydratase/2-oxohepta-3-ene-1,7-dioic acid hydratase in catechol pathway